VGQRMIGLGFPYSATQVGLTLLTVGVPTLFLTLWARPTPPDERLLGNLARFVVPAALVTLTAAFVAVLITPALSDYFGLTGPAPPIYHAVLPALALWFATLTAVYRLRLLDRILGLDQLP
jgi:cation-transporting P-type ATPase E